VIAVLPHETRDTLFRRVFGDEYAKVRAFGVDAESESDAIAQRIQSTI